MAQSVKQATKTTAAQGLFSLSKAKVAFDRRRGTPASKRLLGVIARCLHDDFDQRDRQVFDAVERRRLEMLQSSNGLTKVDFGAGTSESTLSEADMSAGVVKHTTIADVCRLTSKNSFWAKVLYALADEYKPTTALELGTSVGISAGYLGGALQRYGGQLLTIEGAPEIAIVAKATVETLGLREVVEIVVGRFNDVLPQCLSSSQRLDFVFIDGHHAEHATQQYYQLIKPHLNPGAVLVFDDIHWSPGMERAWSAIAKDNDLCVAVDVIANGIAILGSDEKRFYSYPLRFSGSSDVPVGGLSAS